MITKQWLKNKIKSTKDMIQKRKLMHRLRKMEEQESIKPTKTRGRPKKR